MAGGLFGKPLVLNEKCIFFSLIIIGLFFYKPEIKNKKYIALISFVIFVIAYVAMAWYDYFFDCKTLPLKRNKRISITNIFKPPSHDEKKQVKYELDIKDKSSTALLIYGSHVLFIAPLIAYIAIYRNKVNKAIYPVLGALSVFTLGYHGVKFIKVSNN
tara:strand:- start:202 stop:678 length:477 start_codon:yes stop_codon:yes gene_type:complete